MYLFMKSFTDPIDVLFTDQSLIVVTLVACKLLTKSVFWYIKGRVAQKKSVGLIPTLLFDNSIWYINVPLVTGVGRRLVS